MAKPELIRTANTTEGKESNGKTMEIYLKNKVVRKRMLYLTVIVL